MRTSCFGHEEAEQLLKNLAKTAPKLVDELVPKVLPLATVVRVMQGLLAERVPIRNVRAIVEALAEAGPRTQDTQQLHRAGQGCPGSPDRPGHRRTRRRVARHHT